MMSLFFAPLLTRLRPASLMVLFLLGAANAPLSAQLTDNQLTGNQLTGNQLNPGDIYVCDQTAGAILRITPYGSLSVVTSGGFLVRPSDIQFDSNGQLLVVDGGASSLLRIDPMTGQQTLLTNGGSVTAATGLAIEADGNVLVSSALTQSVVRIDPASNSQSAVTAGGATFRPSFLTLTSTGQLLASDDGLDGFSALHQIDPATGTRSILAAGLGVNLDLSELPDGRIATALALTDRVIAVEPGDGSTTVLSSAGEIRSPQGVIIDWQGNILLAQGDGSIVRVDPTGGSQEIVLPPGPRNLFGMAIVPGEPINQIPTLDTVGLLLLIGLFAFLSLIRLGTLSPKTNSEN